MLTSILPTPSLSCSRQSPCISGSSSSGASICSSATSCRNWRTARIPAWYPPGARKSEMTIVSPGLVTILPRSYRARFRSVVPERGKRLRNSPTLHTACFPLPARRYAASLSVSVPTITVSSHFSAIYASAAARDVASVAFVGLPKYMESEQSTSTVTVRFSSASKTRKKSRSNRA